MGRFEPATVSAGAVPAGGDGQFKDDGDCSGVAGVRGVIDEQG